MLHGTTRIGHFFCPEMSVSLCGRSNRDGCEVLHPRQMYCCANCRDASPVSLPVEVIGSFTDMGHPLYEWMVNGHCWGVEPMSHYIKPL